MAGPTIVDNGDTFPNSGAVDIVATITLDGATWDLTGDTVAATVRREDALAEVVHTELEDHAVTLTTAASGIVTLSLTHTNMTRFTVPPDPRKTYPYIVAFKNSTDSRPVQLYRVHVHGTVD